MFCERPSSQRAGAISPPQAPLMIIHTCKALSTRSCPGACQRRMGDSICMVPRHFGLTSWTSIILSRVSSSEFITSEAPSVRRMVIPLATRLNAVFVLEEAGSLPLKGYRLIQGPPLRRENLRSTDRISDLLGKSIVGLRSHLFMTSTRGQRVRLRWTPADGGEGVSAMWTSTQKITAH